MLASRQFTDLLPKVTSARPPNFLRKTRALRDRQVNTLAFQVAT